MLFHEYAHHFMFQYFPAGYPSWYVEAFAETLATIDLHRTAASRRQSTPVADRRSVPFDVDDQSEEAPGEQREAGFRGFHQLLQRWLADEPVSDVRAKPARTAADLLRLVDKGVPSADAATQAFGDLDRLNDEINRYKNKGKLYGADVEDRKLYCAEGPDAPARRRRRSGIADKGAFEGGDHSCGGWRRSFRRPRRRAEVPDSLPAQLELYEAEFDAEHLDAAEAAADRALQLQPNRSTP